MVHGCRKRGFTLIEALTALTVLGVAVAAILTPVTGAIEQKSRAMKQALAVLLAEQLIEECVSQQRWSYDEWPVLGPSAGEVWRDKYDEVVDYHDLTETSDQFGTVFGDMLGSADFPPNLTRRVWMQYHYLPGQNTLYTPDIMLLTVRVHDGDEELVTLRRLIKDPNHVWP
jgi:prepilin-type N-terminal cleavage/methylation domain-containing protein